MGDTSEHRLRRRRRAASPAPVIFILCEDAAERIRLGGIVDKDGYRWEGFSDGRTLFARCNRGVSGCLLIDARVPGAIDLLHAIGRASFGLAVVMMTSRISMAVAAMRAGAADVVEKPVGAGELLDSIRRSLAKLHPSRRPQRKQEFTVNPFAGLTTRQLQVLQRVLAGQPSKNIAADLGISQRTVESHRAVIMHRTGARSLPALARLAVIANWYGDFQ